jgi:hypothetical protein
MVDEAGGQQSFGSRPPAQHCVVPQQTGCGAPLCAPAGGRQQETISPALSGQTIRGERWAAPAVLAMASSQIAVAAAANESGTIKRRIANTTGGETTRTA